MKPNPLSPADRLQELVENINAALGSMEKNVQNIMLWANEIRSKELWRQTKATSYSQFCELQGWTVRRFDQLAAAGALLLALPEKLGTTVLSERAAREAVKLGPETSTTVLQNLKSEGIPATSTAIKNEAAKIAPKKEPEQEIVRDNLGWPIPAELIPFWERRHELDAMMKQLSDIKCSIENGQAEHDDLFTVIGNGIIGEIQTIRWRIKNARAHALCTACNGYPALNGGCSLCKGTGFLPEKDCDILPTVIDVLKIRAKSLGRATE